MRIFGIIFALFAIAIGLRMAVIAIRTALTGQVLVRRGLKSGWQPAPTRDDAWRYAFRDAIMGLLFIILGVALIV